MESARVRLPAAVCASEVSQTISTATDRDRDWNAGGDRSGAVQNRAGLAHGLRCHRHVVRRPRRQQTGEGKGAVDGDRQQAVPSLSVTLVPAARPATVPPTDDTDTQVTLTVLMVSPLESMDPLPLYTVQTCPVGCVNTGTA